MKTTEVDYKQMHPRILMEIDGVYKPMSWEPYTDIKDITGEGTFTNQSRTLSKLAMMCLLNANNLGKAKSALWKIYSDDMKSDSPDFKNLTLKKGSLNSIFDRLIEKNKEISHWFGKERLWSILQHYDSEIAAKIIEKFVNLGKCILPWHDSFVVAKEDKDLLIESMREAWLAVLGNNKNCFYDVEF